MRLYIFKDDFLEMALATHDWKDVEGKISPTSAVVVFNDDDDDDGGSDYDDDDDNDDDDNEKEEDDLNKFVLILYSATLSVMRETNGQPGTSQ